MDSQGGYEIRISVLIVSSSVTWTAKEVMTSELQCFMFLLDVLSFCCVYSTTESTDMEVVEAELCIYCSEISLFSVQEATLCCCEGHITKMKIYHSKYYAETETNAVALYSRNYYTTGLMCIIKLFQFL